VAVGVPAVVRNVHPASFKGCLISGIEHLAVAHERRFHDARGELPLRAVKYPFVRDGKGCAGI